MQHISPLFSCSFTSSLKKVNERGEGMKSPQVLNQETQTPTIEGADN